MVDETMEFTDFRTKISLLSTLDGRVTVDTRVHTDTTGVLGWNHMCIYTFSKGVIWGVLGAVYVIKYSVLLIYRWI
jgi:hypothetical protein